MRYREIDIFKGILTVLMVMAHCMQFFITLKPGMWQYALSEYINLTTFSGFLFAFGFAAWHAYINKPYAIIFPRVFKNVLRMLTAYYISAFGFRIFIEKMPLERTRILDILFLRSIAGWSEFLLSFAAVMVLILCFQPLMKKTGKYLPPIIAIVAIFTCIMPFHTGNAVVATFMGQADFAVFAVTPYCLYFAFGIYAAQSGGTIKLGLIALAFTGTAVFSVVLFIDGLPSRFPLSLPWLLGALGFIYLYYRVSGRLTSLRCSVFFEDIGRNSLSYLLLSNLFIFALKSSRFYTLNTLYAFGVFVVMMALIRYLHGIVVKTVQNGA